MIHISFEHFQAVGQEVEASLFALVSITQALGRGCIWSTVSTHQVFHSINNCDLTSGTVCLNRDDVQRLWEWLENANVNHMAPTESDLVVSPRFKCEENSRVSTADDIFSILR